jgi:16S rRNA (uracil1498-N3)-methyltransferase
MALPFFYISQITQERQIVLDKDTSNHVVQVLRMQAGEKLCLTDGKGKEFICEISDANKKHCGLNIIETKSHQPKPNNISIAISVLKNTNRFEWFLEKATEIGVSEIIPLICVRTEKEKFRWDRMNAICISAMLQSQQYWLPLLHEPKVVNLQTLQEFHHHQKFIAHCEKGDKRSMLDFNRSPNGNSIILIGPEGDFSSNEIEMALQNGFKPVSLGETRLRTETAGVVAVTMLVLG